MNRRRGAGPQRLVHSRKQSSSALVPTESRVAPRIGGLLQNIEPVEVLDRYDYLASELRQGFEGEQRKPKKSTMLAVRPISDIRIISGRTRANDLAALLPLGLESLTSSDHPQQLTAWVAATFTSRMVVAGESH